MSDCSDEHHPSDSVTEEEIDYLSSYLFMKTAEAVVECNVQYYDKTPYHTSALSGEAWVRELLNGHPKRIRCELGVHKHVFQALINELSTIGLKSSRNITREEKLSIFLYKCVTGLSVPHVGERFQRSNDTISRYFHQILNLFLSDPFYNKYVKLPSAQDPIPSFIHNNPKFSPFLDGAIGAIDCSHFDCSPPKTELLDRDRKGGRTQNCLAVCDFDLMFRYIYSGWEGSTSDSYIYHQARKFDLKIPADRYYLADAGFPLCDGLLIPYRSVRFHLRESGNPKFRYDGYYHISAILQTLTANTSPENAQELFNLRHAMARNVIERLFGILKARFAILTSRPRYNLDVLARFPAALAALHNFIRIYDPTEIQDFLDENVDQGTEDLDTGELAYGFPDSAEKEAARNHRDEIAQAMWNEYQRRQDPVIN